MIRTYDNVNVLHTNDEDAETKIEEMEQDKFRIKNYIPRRYHPKWHKYAFIAAGVVLAVIVIILIVVFCTNSSNTNVESNSDTLTNFRGKLIILTNDTKLFKFDPKTENFTLLMETSNRVIDFDVYTDQQIYWTEVNDNNTLKVLVNNSLNRLIDDPRFEPGGMVLDHVSENLYVIDEAEGNLVVVNIRTGDYTLLTLDFVKPREIKLDPEDGLMFILELSKSILRVRMDGTDVTELVQNTGVTSMALDSKRKRLYWINDFVNIESSDYNGNNRQSFFSDVVAINGLAFLDDNLYWFWPSYSYPSNLSSCKVGINDTCEEYTSHAMTTLGDPKYIKSYSSTVGVSIKNPCTINNGGCQQLCLLNSRTTNSCACRMGWQVNPDKKSCREIRDFLLYPQDGLVRVKSIDGAKDLVWPTPYKDVIITNKGQIDFDYDLKNDAFYWSDDFNIYQMSLKSYGKQIIILRVNASNMVIEDIAYDWYTANMYFVQRSKRSNILHSLMLFNVHLGEKFQKTLYTYKYDASFGLQACPYAIALHPANHSMFFTAGENSRRFIQYTNMNGTAIYKIHNTFAAFVHEYRLIAIDYGKDRVYWIWDSDRSSVVKHSTFDGKDTRVINIDVMYIKTIYVHQQWLYVSNLTSIWRVHKEIGGAATRIAPKIDNNRQIAGVRIISEGIQFINKEQACAKEHSVCEQFCLNAADGFADCLCKDGMNVRRSRCS